MPKIILCRGIQGSGKSTWARKWVLEDPEHRVRFNNDDIRNMLGKYWVTSRESLVRFLRDSFVHKAMDDGYDIVIDNMNLSSHEYVVYRGDSKRENPIGEEVIRATYEKYKHIIG